MVLRDSIKTIKGVGDKTAAVFARLGVETVQDLLLYYPRNYVAYENPVDISDLQSRSQKSTWTHYSDRVRKGLLRDN